MYVRGAHYYTYIRAAQARITAAHAPAYNTYMCCTETRARVCERVSAVRCAVLPRAVTHIYVLLRARMRLSRLRVAVACCAVVWAQQTTPDAADQGPTAAMTLYCSAPALMTMLLLIHGPIVMFVLGGVTGLVLANSETDLVMLSASSSVCHHSSSEGSWPPLAPVS